MDSEATSTSGAFVLEVSSRRPPDSSSSGVKYVLHSNLKLFSKAVAALARLGSDLYLEPVEAGLFLRSNNKIKSACGSFLFSNDFFSEVDKSLMEPSGDRLGICRLSMKSALSLFKGLQFNEKNYVSAELWVNPFSDYFMFDVEFAYAAMRSLKIKLMDSATPFKTTADRSKCMNVSVVYAEKLMSFLNMVKRDSEDIIISATPDHFQFKNYIATTEFSRNMVKTTANVPITMFARHEIRRPTEIAFSHKDFLAVLSFAAQHSASISLYYDLPGKPLIVAIEDDVNYVCEFVMVTIECEEGQEEQALGPTATIREADTKEEATTQRSLPAQRVVQSQTERRLQNEQRASQAEESHSEPPRRLMRVDSEVVEVHSGGLNFGHPRMSSSPIRQNQEAGDQLDDLVSQPAERGDDPLSDIVTLEDDIMEIQPMELHFNNDGTIMEVQPMEDPIQGEDRRDLNVTPPPQSSRSIIVMSEASAHERQQTVAKTVTQSTQQIEERRRKKEFRNFFLSSNLSTQSTQSLYGNKTVLANDSDAED